MENFLFFHLIIDFGWWKKMKTILSSGRRRRKSVSLFSLPPQKMRKFQIISSNFYEWNLLLLMMKRIGFFFQWKKHRISKSFSRIQMWSFWKLNFLLLLLNNVDYTGLFSQCDWNWKFFNNNSDMIRRHFFCSTY